MDVLAGAAAFDADLDGGRQVGCLGLDGNDRHFQVVDVARSELAAEVNGHVNGDLLAGADGQQVEVLDDLLDRVALDVLDEGQVLLAVDVQGQQGVGGADGQGGGLRRQGDVDRLGTVAVDDGRDQVGHAGAAGEALAEFGADFCCELLLRHGYLLVGFQAVGLNGVQQGRRSVYDLQRRAAVRLPFRRRFRPSRLRRPAVRVPINSHQYGMPALSLAKVSVQGYQRRDRFLKPGPPPAGLGLAVEQAGDGAVVEHFTDRAGDQRRDGEHGQLREALVRGDRQRVGDHHFAGAGLGQPAGRRIGEHGVGRGDDDILGAGVLEHLDGAGDGSAGIDHVVDQDAGAAFNLAHDRLGDGLVGHGEVPALVHERQRRAAEALGPLLGHADAAGVRRDDRDLVRADPGADVVGQERNGHQVVHGAVEEALDLGSVQVHTHDAVGAGGLVQIGDEACRDRLAAAALLVLPGVGVERGHHSDALGGGPLERIDHDQLFHEPVVQRGGVRLDDEGVGAADALAGPHVDLAVGEVVGVQWAAARCRAPWRSPSPAQGARARRPAPASSRRVP